MLLQVGSPGCDIVNLIGQMSLRCLALDPVLGADVYLPVANLEPEAAASLQWVWLLNLRQTQDPTVELAPLLFGPFRDRYLYDVILQYA